MTIDDIIQAKQQQLSEEKVLVSEDQLRQQASESERVPLSLRNAISGPGLSLIGPIMKGSPYTKTSHSSCIPVGLAKMEQHRGASALMVATEQTFFEGQQQFVGQIRDYTHVPILLYDCIIEQYQLYAAACLGADAVVLMSDVLDGEMMGRFASLLGGLGLEAVAEVHEEKQLRTALGAGISIVLVNNLCLDGSGSLQTTQRLAAALPEGALAISWGGIRSTDDLRQIEAWGVAAACPDQSLIEGTSRHALLSAAGAK